MQENFGGKLERTKEEIFDPLKLALQRKRRKYVKINIAMEYESCLPSNITR